MAKRKINRSQTIRNYLAKNPDAKPREIIAALAKKGVKVSPALVSQVKYKRTSKKRGPKSLRRKNAARRMDSNSHVDIEALVAAKKLVQRIGGVDRAKEALAMLEKLA